MALLHGIRTLLTAKAAPVAAATLVIGGGAAIAAPGVTLDGGDDGEIVDIVVEEEEEQGWAIGRADEEQLERIGEFCDENPEAAFCSGDLIWVPGAPSDEGAEEISTQPEALIEEEDEGRSETARRVLEALSGDEDIMPGGGPEFGRAVSGQPREGQLGPEVSRAARGDDAEGSELEERRKPGPPDHARGGADSNDQDDAEGQVTTNSEPKAERSGPPAASSGNSGNRGSQGGGPGR